MPRLDPDTIIGSSAVESSTVVAGRIASAWAIARERNGGRGNALLRGRQLLRACAMERSTRTTLSAIARDLELTARSVHRVMRVARTIADLRGSASLTAEDLLAAASLRDRSLEVPLAA
jgi:magnesium chelatase family protein